MGLRLGAGGSEVGDMGGLGASGWIGRSCRYIWGHIGSWKGSRKGRGPKGGDMGCPRGGMGKDMGWGWGLGVGYEGLWVWGWGAGGSQVGI